MMKRSRGLGILGRREGGVGWLLVACLLGLLGLALPPGPAGLAAQSSSPRPEDSSSATVQGSMTLSLDEAVERALETGEEVALVRERIVQAEEEITQVRSGALPQVSGNVTYTRQIRSIFDALGEGGSVPTNEGNGMDEGENPFADLPFGRPNTWLATLSVSQTLYAAGQVSIGLDIAERVRALLRSELEEVQADLTRQVRRAYFQAVFADLLVDISEEARALADRQFREVESFRQQGVASEFDVLTARVERDNLEPQIVEARSAARLARQNLRRLVNLPRNGELQLTTALEAELQDVDRRALEDAVLDRPSLQAAEEQILIGEDRVRLARSGYRPTASAFAEIGYQSFPRTVFPDSDWREDWTVGVQISVPIFNGFRTGAEVEEARSGVRQSRLERQQVEEGLLLEFDAAVGDFESALSQVTARRATVEQADQARALAELRFTAGSATALELSNARLNLQQARVNEAEALLLYVESLALLERVTGGEVPLLSARIREVETGADAGAPGHPGNDLDHNPLEG